MAPKDNQPSSEDPQRADVSEGYQDALGPSKAEIDEWVERQKQKRQAWLAGPSEEDKRAWVRAERRKRLCDELDDDELSCRVREEHLARTGLLSFLVATPSERWSRLIQAGRDFEERRRLYRSRRARVRLPEDDC
jgi:hypothetical protein